jgi:uncharacterized protein (TIGR03086 family)
MSNAPLEDLANALTGFRDLVEGVPDDRWSAPTPCPEWNVRELVNHMTGNNLFVSTLLRGKPRPSPEELAAFRARDFLGSDPIAAFELSADELNAAFASPGALDRLIVMPIGTVPGAEVVGLRLTETVVHGWDLASATSQPTSFDEQQLTGALDFTRRTLGNLPPSNRAFGPKMTARPDATLLQQLLALLGRDPAWKPPTS